MSNQTQLFKLCFVMKYLDEKRKIFSKLFFYLTIYLVIFDNLFSQELFSNYKKYDQSSTKYKLTKITSGLDFAWGMTFIDDINLVVTRRRLGPLLAL